MPEPDDTEGAFDRLDKRLGAFDESRRSSKPALPGIGGEAGDGYRLLGQMLGGVLGGLGLGWLADRVFHTGPWGIVLGVIVGTGLSIYAAIRTASAISARAEKSAGVSASVRKDGGE